MQRITAIFVCLVLYWISTPAQSAEISGALAAAPSAPGPNNGATPEGSVPVQPSNQPHLWPPNPHQSPAAPAAPVKMGANQYRPNRNGTFDAQTLASTGTSNPQFAPPTPGMNWDQIYENYDSSDVAAAQTLYPGNLRAQTQYLEGQKQIQLDRQQGNSYSVGVHW